MAKYLLACSCGKEIVVEDGQAGGQAACQCGAVLDVPTLRKLRHLPAAPDEVDQPKANWTFRHGLLAAAIIVACASAGLGALAWWSSPQPEKYDPAANLRRVDQVLEELTPTLAWDSWLYYSGLKTVGFSEIHSANESQIEAEAARHRIIYSSAFAVALVSLIGALIIVILPRAEKSR